jgi:hypothetical protein
MSREHDLERRELLRILVTLPVGLAVGCKLGDPESADLSNLSSPEESLRHLIQVLGPWPEAERQAAERFAERFLAAPHAVAPFLPDSGELVQSLAARFPAGVFAVPEIVLEDLPPSERELMLSLTQYLYSLVEVRFHVAGEPAWGLCPEDRLRHTLGPSD